MKTFNRIAIIIALSTPFFALAAKDFKWLVGFIISSFVKPATWLIMSLAVVFFLWNMAMAVKNSDNSEELEKFKSKAVWGIVAIAAMVSMWGLVNFVTGSLQLDTTIPVTIPGLPSPQG
ncbi:MAG: hypothetical protein AAB497_03865 [Patescibacteria group bacterium]